MSKLNIKIKTIVVLIIIATVFICVNIVVNMNRKSNSKDDKKKYVLQLAELQGDNYPTSLADKKFAQLVDERSDGRIRIEVVTGGELGEESEVIEKMQNKTLAFARVSIAPMAEYVDSLNALMMPYLYKDADHMWRVLDSELGREMLESVSNAGLVGLAWYDSGARGFYFRDKVSTLQELKNKKIRVQTSSLMFAMCEALGSYPMTGAENEIAQDVQMGTLDGAENNIPTYVSFKQYETCKYFLEDEHTRIPDILVGSSAVLEELSKEDLNLLKDCAKQTEQYEREQWNKAEEEAKKLLQDKGAVLITLTDAEKEKFIQASKSLYEEFGSEYQEIMKKINQIQ